MVQQRASAVGAASSELTHRPFTASCLLFSTLILAREKLNIRMRLYQQKTFKTLLPRLLKHFHSVIHHHEWILSLRLIPAKVHHQPWHVFYVDSRHTASAEINIWHGWPNTDSPNTLAHFCIKIFVYRKTRTNVPPSFYSWLQENI